MRAPLVFCAAAVFHAVLVASPRGDEDHEIQNSTTTTTTTTTRDVECERANCTGSSHGRASTTSDKGEDDHERRGRACPSRINASPRRLRARPRDATGGDRRAGRGRQADRVPRMSNGTEGERSNVDASLPDRADEDDAPRRIHDGSLDDRRHGGLGSLLARLIKALENDSRGKDGPGPGSGSGASDESAASGLDDEDRCQKWLDNWEKIERAFPGSVADLPACPCLYPNGIFYDNQIRDKRRGRTFRWRDVSHDRERLAIYKPNAVYCVRTLPSRENESAVAQHCCYDENRELLTRGSGAGTPYIVSPDISPLLHDKIDLLPWRLCKGDFTRYNEVRIPNNDNNCTINPDNEEYQRQVERAKNY